MKALQNALAPIIKILNDETLLGVGAVLIVRFIVLSIPELEGESGNFANILTLTLVGLFVYRQTLPQLIENIAHALADTYDFADVTRSIINELRLYGADISPEVEAIMLPLASSIDEKLETPKG